MSKKSGNNNQKPPKDAHINYDTFIKQSTKELENILNFWQLNTIDSSYGGFYGRRDHFNKLIPKAEKGIILNTRILWSFSAAGNFYGNTQYLEICKRAFSYLKDKFKDEEYGGVYWMVDYKGSPSITRKQTYAQAFTIYSLSEYYKYSLNRVALDWAMEIFYQLEKVALDVNLGGYIESFKRDWKPIEDMRLSEKDLNASKTMNTHLHILEAYT
ncbi:AGE family epimerase/isomerase, partial [Eudoraea sp.]|uniref:AGE family epimerase/isomerase n=1 Tax=Eudoraea sp. TaxID=1979955 RepID=UPI003C790822